MTTLRDLVLKNRSYRRFYEDQTVTKEVLLELVDLARLSPSGGNLQALKFITSCETEKNKKIFECLFWAGYLKDWSGPEKGERPSAYIVILGDNTIKESVKIDQGIAAQTILLGAVEKDFGGCIFGSIKRELLKNNLNIPPHLDILLVLAIGKPKEEIQLEEINENGNIRYWRDEAGIHHVPKRDLNQLIID